MIAACALALGHAYAAEAPREKAARAVAYTIPAWFKASFLDFREDVRDARRQGRHVMVFLHLDGCPYCAQMLRDNFTEGDNYTYIRKHFDVIAVNVRGALDAVWTDGRSHTESELARRLKVYATPTIVFLGEDGAPVVQLSGYRDPPAFRRALEFVQAGSYRTATYSEARPAGAR